MASNTTKTNGVHSIQKPVKELLQQKISILKEVLKVTQKTLLLVDLEKLTPLLEEKDDLLERVKALDEAISTNLPDGKEWDSMPEHQIMAEVIQAILENEVVLEKRIEAEFAQLKTELREFDRETRLKKYLEKEKPRKGQVNLKR